jgi:hypothetical protein
MTTLIALLPVILANMPAIVSVVQSTVKWILTLRAAAQQTQEWTPQAEAAFQYWLVSTQVDPAWLTDAELAAKNAVAAK